MTCVDLAGTETNQQTGFDLDAKNQALFINESLHHLAKVTKLVVHNVPLQNIKFDHDPLTLILKNALAGPVITEMIPKSMIRMFVNISPTKFDTAVTNRSLKFAKQTGRIKTKTVAKDAFRNLQLKTIKREEFFQQNDLKLLKSSPADEAVNYQMVYPDTQEDISELLHIHRNKIIIKAFSERHQMLGIKFVY